MAVQAMVAVDPGAGGQGGEVQERGGIILQSGNAGVGRGAELLIQGLAQFGALGRGQLLREKDLASQFRQMENGLFKSPGWFGTVGLLLGQLDHERIGPKRIGQVLRIALGAAAGHRQGDRQTQEKTHSGLEYHSVGHTGRHA